MYVIVIMALSLILAFDGPPLEWVAAPGKVLAVVCAATLLPAGVAWLVGRRALRLLERNPADPGIGQFALNRGMLIVRTVLGLAQVGVLALTNWLVLCRAVPIIGQWPLVPGVLAATPLVIAILLVWTAIYPADRAVRAIALETWLFRSRPVRPLWPLGRYLLFNLRHQVLFILVPMLLILAARDLIVHYETELRAWAGHPLFPDVLLGTSAGAVALVAPMILRRVWVTQALPPGPLRDRLVHLSRKLRMRCREILVWHTGGMMINAAVMGVLAPFRYFLITDGMLEQMDDVRVEAVFGHEAGHVKKHHILFFLLFAAISGCLVTLAGDYCRGADRKTYEAVVTLTAAGLTIKWGLLFGWLSRRFERQADIFGVRTLMLAGLPCEGDCPLHDPSDPAQAHAAQKGDPLCVTAAQVFAQTLQEVAQLNGIPPRARSWRHGSIASRVATILRLAHDPLAVAAFERGTAWVKLAVLAAVVAVGAVTVWRLRLWTLLPWWPA